MKDEIKIVEFSLEQKYVTLYVPIDIFQEYLNKPSTNNVSKILLLIEQITYDFLSLRLNKQIPIITAITFENIYTEDELWVKDFTVDFNIAGVLE